MRACLTALMAILVVAALFWGNCFTCPQMLLASAQHSCCHRDKTPAADCNTQSLRAFVKVEKAAPVSALPVTVAALAPPLEFAHIVLVAAPQPLELTPALAVPLRI